MPDLVIWTDQLDPARAEQVAGAKMGRLAALARAGLRVPDGFTVTVQAWREQFSEPVLAQEMNRLAANPGATRALIAQTLITAGVAEAITAAYADLSLRRLEVNVPTAVRSSAVDEDGARASYAGMLDSYLGVCGTGRVLDAVRRCWASAFAVRAVTYRDRHDDGTAALSTAPTMPSPMAVGVLDLVPARASGVAFSAHPVTGSPDRGVIEASWGWGEVLVQGLVTPDHVEVDTEEGRILRYDIAAKTVVSAFDHAAGRVVAVPMPADLVHRRVLDEEEIGAVLDAVRRIEALYRHPVDVEWVLPRDRRPGDRVVVVQARPITVNR